MIGVLLGIGALAPPLQGPVRPFGLSPEPGGWSLIFRPAMAAAVIAPDGEWVALAIQREGQIEALALKGRSGQVQARLQLGTTVCCLPPPLAMGPDGRWALVAGDAVGWYAPGRGGRLLFRIGPPDSAVVLAVASGGQAAAIATMQGRVLLFHPQTGAILRRWDPASGRRESPGVAFTPDGQELWIAWNRRLEVWSLAAGTLRAARPLPFDGTMVMAAIAHDGAEGLVVGYSTAGLEGWRVRRKDLVVQGVLSLGIFTLPRLQAAGDGFRIDGVWEPFQIRVHRDGRVERVRREPPQGIPMKDQKWIETVCAGLEGDGRPCGWLLGTAPPLADRFRWIQGIGNP